MYSSIEQLSKWINWCNECSLLKFQGTIIKLSSMTQNQKYQTSSSFRPAQNPQLSYTRYNLCFAISKRKESDKKLPKASNHLHSKEQSLQFFRGNNNSIEDHPHSSARNSKFMQSQSTSFFTPKKQKERNYLLPEEVCERQGMQYIRCGFPQRKKRSGQQQLLKLLLKFSDNLEQKRQEMQSPNKNPLFSEDNPEIQKGIIPRLKNRTRYNWVKDRYCANRDKEGQMIPETERYGYTPRASNDMIELRRNISHNRVL